MTAAYGVLANRETPADTDGGATHPAFMVLDSIAHTVPACVGSPPPHSKVARASASDTVCADRLFWSTLGGAMLEDMKPERDAAKRVAACVTMAVSLDAVAIYDCAATLVERLRHCATVRLSRACGRWRTV